MKLSRQFSLLFTVSKTTAGCGTLRGEQEAIYGLDDITLRKGCEVILQWNGTGFSRSTVGENCESTLREQAMPLKLPLPQ